MKSIMIDGNERVDNEVFYDKKEKSTMVVDVKRYYPFPVVVCRPMEQFEAGMLIRFEEKLYRIAGKYFTALHARHCLTCRCERILNSVLPPQNNDDRNMNELSLELIEEPKLVVKEKRHLSISVLTRDSAFVIASQSHHGENFAFSGNSFIASNGIVLISDTQPKLLANGMVLFVHGRDSTGCNTFIKVTDKQYAKIMAAAAEYNETNGGSPKPEWPLPGDIFFAVGGMFVISEQYDPVTCKHLKDSNNIFQEREAAEKAVAALPAFYKSFQ